ncbi:TPR domain protein [Chondrocystis sp. NIES-4102]|nr:TPR domain protein [Chondrocystis sp. NIES-4102]
MINIVKQQLELIKDQAVVKHKEGEKQKAISLYFQALELDENQPAWIYGNVITLLAETGQVELALDLKEQALKIHHQTEEVNRAIGLALNKQGDIENSIKYYLKALDINSNQPDWLYANLIENFSLQNKFEQAIAIGEKAVEIYPNCGWSNYHLGNCFAALNQWSKAINAYKIALSRNIESAQLQEKIDSLIQKNLLNIKGKNITIYLRAVDFDSSNLAPYYKLLYEDYKTVLILLKLALNLIATNNLSNAIQYYKQAIALNSQLVSFYLAHQDVFIDHFDVPKLINILQQEVGVISQTSVVLPSSNLNSLDYKYQKLLYIYHQALQLYPNEVEIYLEIANIYAQQNRFVKAISVCQRALYIAPQNLNLQILLTQFQNIQKRTYTSIQNLEGETSTYTRWLQKNSLQSSDLDWIPEIIDTFAYKPVFSIVVIVSDISVSHLVEMLESVLLQLYPYWEFYLVCEQYPAREGQGLRSLRQYLVKPQIITIIEEYIDKDPRIKLIVEEQQQDLALIYNSALKLLKGEFIIFLSQGDILAINSLYQIAELLNRHPEADIIYSDEDLVNEAGKYYNPYFKPDWCPDSFLSRMYTGQLGVYRHSTIQETGGFRTGYQTALIYDLVLRLTEKTNNIFHIPKILYHGRISATDVKEINKIKENKRAIEDALNRRRESGRVIENNQIAGIYTIRYSITTYKLVSIIIPTKNRGEILDKCLKSIFEKTTYPHYEVLIIDNGTEEENTLKIIQQWQNNHPDKCFCYRLDIAFNYSKLNNFGVSKAKGDYLLFLNNDTEIITKDWIEGMVEQAQRNSIGVVGAMLLYPDNTIQHAGVILGIRGVASHSHKYFQDIDPGYLNQLVATNNYSAVTAACLMCRREIFQEVNGFDETLQVAFNDVDFCLKIKTQGYNNIWLPYVVLYHYESQSRGEDDTPEKQARFQQEVATMNSRWGKLIEQDPCYNINLSNTKEDYSLRE